MNTLGIVGVFAVEQDPKAVLPGVGFLIDHILADHTYHVLPALHSKRELHVLLMGLSARVYLCEILAACIGCRSCRPHMSQDYPGNTHSLCNSNTLPMQHRDPAASLYPLNLAPSLTLPCPLSSVGVFQQWLAVFISAAVSINTGPSLKILAHSPYGLSGHGIIDSSLLPYKFHA